MAKMKVGMECWGPGGVYLTSLRNGSLLEVIPKRSRKAKSISVDLAQYMCMV